MDVIKKITAFILPALFFTVMLTGCETEEVPEPYEPEPPEWSYNSTIYEVNVRQFSEEGTFEKVEEAIPRLHEMGIEILWLMPIHPIGEVERKGTLGSYYSVQDYYGINPEFGDEDSFRSLVETAHEHDMKIILDWVANHTAWDNPLTETNPDFYERDEDGNLMPPRGTDWSDVVQLDFENEEVWNYMVGALRYWVEEFNIDGYRADVAYMVPTEFWNRVRAELDEIKPVFMLAEAAEPELHPAFDMSYGWELHHAMNAIAAGEESLYKLDEILNDYRVRFPENAFMMQFTSNHDENSWAGTVFDRMGDGAKTFAVLSFTVPGMPLIYNGQEVGLDKQLEFFEKDPIDWDYDSPFKEFYTKLVHLKRDHPALQNGDRGALMTRIETSEDGSIYAFSRDTGDESVVVFLNLSGQPVDFDVNSPLPDGTFTELFTDEETDLSEVDAFDFSAWEYRVFVK